MKHWFAEFLSSSGVMVRGYGELIGGMYKIKQLGGPVISIFGGKAAWQEGKYAQQATRLAKACVEKNFSVLTGGGPGIMEAANCGALQAGRNTKKSWTLGIGLHGIDTHYTNPCAPVYTVSYFFVRRWLLLNFSCGFSIFPGGIGTVNELFSLLDLIKLKKLPWVPIVLIDQDYWRPLVTWYTSGIEKEFILPEYKNLFKVVETEQEAFDYLMAHINI